MASLDDYFDALNRLISGSPVRVNQGAKINNDNVALEAGRGRGSIKRSRPVFEGLINAIERAAGAQGESSDSRVAEELAYYKLEYEKALARELSLVVEIIDLKRRLAKVKPSSIRLVKPISE